MGTEILTTNQLAEFEASVMRALRGESTGPSLAFVRLVYSSHEALRAALAASEAKNNELRLALDANADQLAQEIATARTLCEQRDAALADVARLTRGINVVGDAVCCNGGEVSRWTDNLRSGREWNANIPAPPRMDGANTASGVCGTRDPRGCAELDLAKTCFAQEKRRADAALATSRQMREALAELVEAMRLWGAEEDGIPEELGKACKPFASWKRAKAMIDGAAIAADAKVECEGCKRLRDLLGRVIGHVESSLTVEHGVGGVVSQVVRYDSTVADRLPTLLRDEARAALAAKGGGGKTHATCAGCKYQGQGFEYPCSDCDKALAAGGADKWTAAKGGGR